MGHSPVKERVRRKAGDYLHHEGHEEREGKPGWSKMLELPWQEAVFLRPIWPSFVLFVVRKVLSEVW